VGAKSSPEFTEKLEKACRLLAEDALSDEQIAAECGVTRRALAKWKKRPGFAARLKQITTAYADRALKHGLARRERRIAVLNELHDKMLKVIDDRAKSDEYATLPGGQTGLVVKTLKGIGKGDDFQVVEVYEVDTGTLKEIRGTQEQAAKELGQWVDKQERSHKDPRDMTDDELRNFISRLKSDPRAAGYRGSGA
jgi:Helix-turn-helix of insertion element transposase